MNIYLAKNKANIASSFIARIYKQRVPSHRLNAKHVQPRFTLKVYATSPGLHREQQIVSNYAA